MQQVLNTTTVQIDSCVEVDLCNSEFVTAEFLGSRSCGLGRASFAPTLLRPPSGETHEQARDDIVGCNLIDYNDGCYECEVLDSDHLTLLEFENGTVATEVPSSSTGAPTFIAENGPIVKNARSNFDNEFDDTSFEDRIEEYYLPDTVEEAVAESVSTQPRRRLS